MPKDYGEYFNIAHIESESHIYGPGQRFVIWLQGCKLACKGCWNHEMWSFKAKELVHRDELLRQILDTPELKGITLLGGEPLHQCNNIIWLFNQVRARSKLTIFLYTGYEENELTQMGLWDELHALCDMIAIGRYRQELRNINRQWLGSDNQLIIYPDKTREKQQPKNLNEVELIISDSGALRVLGFPDQDLL